jgi:WD40 repeat protein
MEAHLKSVNCVAFSPDSKHALSGSADQTLGLWDLDSGHLLQTFSGHGTSVVRCAFSSDGRWALSAGEDGAMRTWDLIDRGPVGMLPPGDRVLALATASDGWRAVNASLRLWDFSRAARFRQAQAALAAARDRLSTQPDDAGSLQTIDHWFNFRGQPRWGVSPPSQSN